MERLLRILSVTVLAGLLACADLHAGTRVLRIMCWDGYAPAELVKTFEQEMRQQHGLAVRVEVTSVSDPQEFFDAVRGGRVDVISPAHNIPKSERWPYIKSKLVLPLDLANIPHYRDLIGSLQKADYITADGAVYGAPLLYGPYGLMYRQDQFDAAPDSWSVLVQPKWRGRYAISSDYHEANIYVAALIAGFRGQQLFDYELLAADASFKEALAKLASGAAVFWTGVETADDLKPLALAAGWGFAIPDLKQLGQVWEIATPKEGSTGWVDNWMLGGSLKEDPELKRIAELWINFTLSPKSQAHYWRSIRAFPVNPRAAGELSAAEAHAAKLDQPRYLTDHLILWRPLSTRQQNGFRLLWQSARSGGQAEQSSQRESP